MSDWFITGLFFGLLSGFLLWTAIHSTKPGIDIHKSPGVRVPSTLESEEAWHAAHKRAQPYFFGSGLLLSLVAIGFLVWASTADVPGSATPPTLIALAAATLVLGVGALLGVRAAGAVRSAC
ncbi:hypothetical protein GCM10007147_18070 [Nocardiopsis kunsanensis]|uniref:SdpI family protein n=1 Tax=Nocardiopsis kunsanensis TaxID=141693 RepID=A0A918XBT9_9ACTN|nr:SdpI family protein [Nocardiopsis kunsanensis]GHD23204.1 hypothetical protein GCM10007147_18070 [Nocardiopsis kunsanensis]